MTEIAKPKKSVTLAGVVAGNTALCTVGRTGNDLHYRGYDILDVAEQCEFEEIAPPPDPRCVADTGATRGIQSQAAVSTRSAGGSEAHAGSASCCGSSDGCDA